MLPSARGKSVTLGSLLGQEFEKHVEVKDFQSQGHYCLHLTRGHAPWAPLLPG